MNVAIIGTVGVPANYGGFETLVEQLLKQQQNQDIQYTVYCSSKAYKKRLKTYCNANLKYINLNANGIQSIPYDIISLIKASIQNDVILVLGVSGCAFLPLFRLFSKKKLIINIDGLEHKREKWSKLARKFLKYSEHQAIKYANEIVTDNQGITDYAKKVYNIDSHLIAYGGDQVLIDLSLDETTKVLDAFGLKSKDYDLAICRIEPENNVHTILHAYERLNRKLFFIGNWEKSEYGRSLKDKYANSSNISLHNGVYDLKSLCALRQNCAVYLHGHSAGGTNPSLVEAMHFGVPIIAFDCIYNRESTENKALYFQDSDSLKSLFGNVSDEIGIQLKQIADKRYIWKDIVTAYESIY